MTTRTLRASRMPLAVKCPGSVHPAEGETLIDPHNEAADLGSAVHELMATIVEAELDCLPAITPVAQRWGVDPDELGGVAGQAWKLMRKVLDWFDADAEIEAEVEMQSGPLTGHADLLGWHDERTLLVVDLKTGRLDADHYDQMAAYAWLAFQRAGGFSSDVERVLVAVLWSRDAEVEVYEFGPAQLDRWRRKVADDVLDWDGTYHPGPHCQHCPRFASCPARRAMIRQQVADLRDDLTDDDIENVVRSLVADAEASGYYTDRLADLAEQAKAIENLAHQFRSTVRDQIAAAGGELQGDEKRIRVELQNRQYLKSRKAWAVLSRHVSPDKLLDAATLSKTRALDLITADVERGGKKAAREAVVAELEEAGAVEVKEIKRLSVKRSDRAIEARSEA